MCVEWFTGKKLATALGITMTVSRLVRLLLRLDLSPFFWPIGID
jgi:hypothetical protein